MTSDSILVDLPDGQTVRCRVVNVNEDGTIQVVPALRRHPPIASAAEVLAQDLRAKR